MKLSIHGLQQSRQDRLFTVVKLDTRWIDTVISASVGVSGAVGGLDTGLLRDDWRIYLQAQSLFDC